MGVDYDNSRSKRKRKGLKRKTRVKGGSKGCIQLPKNYYHTIRKPIVHQRMADHERYVEDPGSNMSVSQSLTIPFAGKSAVVLPPYYVPKSKKPQNLLSEEERHFRYLDEQNRKDALEHPEWDPLNPSSRFNNNFLQAQIAHDMSDRHMEEAPFSEPYFTFVNPTTKQIISIRPSKIVPDSDAARAYVRYYPDAAEHLLSDYRVEPVVPVIPPVLNKRDVDVIDVDKEIIDVDGNIEEVIEDDEEFDPEEFPNRHPREEKEVREVEVSRLPVVDPIIDVNGEGFKKTYDIVSAMKKNPVKKLATTLDRFNFIANKREYAYSNGRKVLVPLHVENPNIFNSILTPLSKKGKWFVDQKVQQFRALHHRDPTQKDYNRIMLEYRKIDKISDEDLDKQVKMLRNTYNVVSMASAKKRFDEKWNKEGRSEFYSSDAPALASYYIDEVLKNFKINHPELEFHDAAIRKAEDLERRRLATRISRTHASKVHADKVMDNFIDTHEIGEVKEKLKRNAPVLSSKQVLKVAKDVVNKYEDLQKKGKEPSTKEQVGILKQVLNEAVNNLPGNIGSILNGNSKPPKAPRETKEKRSGIDGKVVANRRDITLPMNGDDPSAIANAQAILELKAKMHAGNVKDVDAYW